MGHPMIKDILCFSCKHLRRSAPLSCRAYQDGIPEDILDGTLDHDSPRPDDGGTQYERAGPGELDHVWGRKT